MESLTFPSETKVTPPELILQTLPLAHAHQACHPGGIVVMGTKVTLGREGFGPPERAYVAIKGSKGPLVKGGN